MAHSGPARHTVDDLAWLRDELGLAPAGNGLERAACDLGYTHVRAVEATRWAT